jgi:enamine deaminase RidA (YjgF/YER057c/UK114 family)
MDAPSRRVILRSPDTYNSWHFAEATRVGDTVWVSGQRGYDERDEISPDPDEQARVAFRNLVNVLRRAGTEVSDIVSLTTCHTDMSHVAGFRAVKDEFIPPPYPSWTVIGVQALAEPEMLVEIAAVAVVGSGRNTEVVEQ